MNPDLYLKEVFTSLVAPGFMGGCIIFFTASFIGYSLSLAINLLFKN